MSAATAAVDTPEKPGNFFANKLPLAADTVIYAGTLVGLNASGQALPADDAAAIKIAGRAEETVDNTDGSAGDLTILVKRGVFRFANSGSAAIAAAHVGEVCFVEDDNTVANSGAGASVPAGIVAGLDDDGVWVDNRFPNALSGFRIYAAGIHAWDAGAATADNISVPGILATDIIQTTLVGRASTETLVLSGIDAGDEEIDLTLSANGTNTTTKIAYLVLRAI